MVAVQADYKRSGFFHEALRAGSRAAHNPVGSCDPAPSTLFPSQAGRQRGMSWIKTLMKFWKGQPFANELERSKKCVEEAREAIRETRAVMDGEDSWLMRQRECKLNHEGEP